METFVLYMLLYPEVQRKAREEIEGVYGKDTFPQWDEAHKLPYVVAVLKEVLRIAPVAVLGSYNLLCYLLGAMTYNQVYRIAPYARTFIWVIGSRKT